MTLVLAGDVGGTKTILRLVETQGGERQEALFETRYSSHDFPDLVPMVADFLKTASQKTGQKMAPQKACFAIAGPVTHQTSLLTNLGWCLESERLEKDLHLDRVRLINDFEAVGYGVLGLQPEDLLTLQAGKPEEQAPIAVIGAGTGLGQGFLIWQGEMGYSVYPSEGGHADFAPRSETEFQLLKYLIDKHDIQRVSAERVISGQGIVAIYQFLRDRHFASESSEIAQAVRSWEEQAGRSEKTIDPAAEIAQAALEGRDRLSEQTMAIFVEAYGGEAGNLALKLLPYGGLYVAGGIAGKNLPLMKEGSFLRSFSHKGRMRSLLERVPVHIVLNPQVGLIGAALCAARL
ncbi:MAG: glucokinase [Leptolyngbyaceae cyanobacterium bins.59]|nr:glucokinase [Leptolyngbyaceae cyanobacterium bins.59]